jgi:hypothetical protein
LGAAGSDSHGLVPWFLGYIRLLFAPRQASSTSRRPF